MGTQHGEVDYGSETRPNIVWLTVESLRADHTSMAGYDRDTTPNIKQIADSSAGVWFPRCFAHSLWTPASSASILTGTYFSHHRVGWRGAHDATLRPGMTTLPAELAKRGYHTAGLSPSPWISDESELSRGFEQFTRLSPGRLPTTADPRSLAKYGAFAWRDGPGYSLEKNRHNLSYIQMDMAKRWLRSFEGSKEPFFFYTHVPNPHHPYSPSRRVADRFTDDLPVTAEQAIDKCLEVYADSGTITKRIATGCDLTPLEWAAIKAMYDAELVDADRYVGAVFDLVQSLDLGETIVVITGDHGEFFGELGLLGHNLALHDAVTHVPLVTHGLNGVGETATELVQHIDVTTTLANVIGCESKQFQGIDLRDETRDLVLSQRGEASLDAYRQHGTAFHDALFHEQPVDALRSNEHKFVQSAEHAELFRLPDEATDMKEVDERECDRLASELERIRADVSYDEDTDGQRTEFTDEMEQQLSDLGYL